MVCPPAVSAALRLSALLALTLAGAACGRDDAPATTVPAPAPAHSSAAAPASVGAGRLEDVIETTPQYLVGITYPPVASHYPGLAVELRRYAEQARREVVDAAKARAMTPGDPPYELTLGFTRLVDSPTLVAIAADGSRYTGGAHSEAMVARFNWLPGEQRMLTATELVPGADGWRAIAAMVRSQLRTAARQRLEADGVAPVDRAISLATSERMIDDGTRPDASHFAIFEPVMAADGRVGAVRFVFPPYQVGPYSDGTQTVDVPAPAMLPHVAARYRPLFTASAG